MTKKEKPKGEIQPVGDAIRQLLNTYQLTAKFDEATLLNAWESIVGKPIARQTKKLHIRNKVLFVEFESAAMKHTFAMHKTKVLEVLARQFGNQIVAEIIIM